MITSERLGQTNGSMILYLYLYRNIIPCISPKHYDVRGQISHSQMPPQHQEIPLQRHVDEGRSADWLALQDERLSLGIPAENSTFSCKGCWEIRMYHIIGYKNCTSGWLAEDTGKRFTFWYVNIACRSATQRMLVNLGRAEYDGSFWVRKECW